MIANIATSMMISDHTIHMPDPDPDRLDYEPVDEDSNKAEGKDEKLVAMSISPFFDISGGSMREKTGYGSYIDVDSVGMDAGLAIVCRQVVEDHGLVRHESRHLDADERDV